MPARRFWMISAWRTTPCASSPTRSRGRLPAVCVASVWKTMPGSVSLAIRAHSPTGQTTPVSLFDTNDPDGLLAITATETKLGGPEEAIDDQDVLVNTAVDDLRLAIRSDDKDRRHFALDDAARELDIDAATVVIDRDRPPGRRVARQSVSVVAGRGHGNDGCRRNALPLSCGKLGIGPGDGGHIRVLT